MMPQAGGQYVYLREAYSPLWGFLYGWTLFLVIQTGHHRRRGRRLRALPGRAGARDLADRPGSSRRSTFPTSYAIQPLDAAARRHPADRLPHLAQHPRHPARQADPEHLHLGQDPVAPRPDRARHPRRPQRRRHRRQLRRFLDAARRGADPARISAWSPAVAATAGPVGLFVAFCVAQVGSLFSSDAWNNITFTAGEVKNPRRNVPLSLALGTLLVIGLYLLANVAYLCTLPLRSDPDRARRPGRHRGSPGDLRAGRRDDHGGRHHHLDLRLQQRPDPGRRPRLLRDGAATACSSARTGRLNERHVPAVGLSCSACGPAPGAAAHPCDASERLLDAAGEATLRQPLRQPARLRRLRGADLLRPDDRRPLRAAAQAAGRRAALPGLRLPGGAGALHPGRDAPSCSCCSSTRRRRPGRGCSSC